MEHADPDTVIATTQPHNVQSLQTLGENVIYLMGFSFILGSLFTILILIMLDVMRRHSITKFNASN